MAMMTMAINVSISRLESLTRQRLRLSQPKVRSITKRLETISKPSICGGLLMISNRSPALAAMPAVMGP